MTVLYMSSSYSARAYRIKFIIAFLLVRLHTQNLSRIHFTL